MINQFSSFLFILIAFSSCLEEQKEIVPEIENPNQIAKVKDWFEKNKEELKIRNDGFNHRTESQDLILPFFEKEPDWDKFHHFTFPDGREVFEINIANNNLILFDEFSKNHFETDSQQVVIQNILFIKNIKNGNFDPLLVRYFPHDEKSIRDFKNISYDKIGIGWSGTIDVWTYDERHFIGFNVKNGVLNTTSKLKSINSESSKIGITTENKVVVQDCVTKPRLVTYTYCQAAQPGVPWSNCIKTGTYSVYEGTETIC